MSQVVEKIPFKMFPLNKTSDNVYSFHSSSPIIDFQFQETGSRVLDRKSLRLCGRFRLINRNNSKSALPANRFDRNCSANASPQDFEKVAYISDRVSVSSAFSSITISNLRGNIFEQARSYGRMLSSLKAVSSSFKDYCSINQNVWGSYANQNCIANALSGDIPFACPMRCGFLLDESPLALTHGGLKISLQLANDAQVVYGLNGSDYVFQLHDLFLSGSYLLLDQELKPERGEIIEYHAYNSFLNNLNSSLEHANLNLNLKEVVSIYSNFSPSTWTSSFKYDGFSTPKIMNADNVETDLNEVRFNRGATMYPLTFAINERSSNANDGFETQRSRHFLNAVAGYTNLTHSTISAQSEALTNYQSAEDRFQNGTTTITNFYNTNQDVDRGSVNSWVFANGNAWTKDGYVEKSGRVYGIGVRMDQLLNDSPQDYSRANYNYSINSDHDGFTPNSVFTFCLSRHKVFSDGMGGVVSAS